MGHQFELLSSQVLEAAVDVHKTLGPGFLESIYENALVVALEERGITCETQIEIPIFYHGIEVGKHRVDLIVSKEMVVELKAIKEFENIHFATVRSYLKATHLRVGLLLNFNIPTLSIKRIVYED